VFFAIIFSGKIGVTSEIPQVDFCYTSVKHIFVAKLKFLRTNPVPESKRRSSRALGACRPVPKIVVDTIVRQSSVSTDDYGGFAREVKMTNISEQAPPSPIRK
jgi:hypothetical protein